MRGVACLVEDQGRRRRVPGRQGPIRELLHQLQHARVWPLHLRQNKQRSAPPASSCTSCSARASGRSTSAKTSNVHRVCKLLHQLQHARIWPLHLCTRTAVFSVLPHSLTNTWGARRARVRMHGHPEITPTSARCTAPHLKQAMHLTCI